MSDKVRTQVQIDRRHYTHVKRLAYERGESMSAVLRQILDQAFALESDAGSDAVREARLAMVGAGRDAHGKRDVARRHDAYLYGHGR